jgi:hypothetical protein
MAEDTAENTAEDVAGDVARAAARRLVPEFGPRVEAEVEGALYARDTGERHEYDPVSIGILIVAIATLAWEIYSRHADKGEHPDAGPEVTERVLHNEIRHEIEVTPDSVRVTEVVVQEIVRRTTVLLEKIFVLPCVPE